eukprot:COSAG05_NODE_468_length_9525_cov_30.402292_5_plen_530_part_00
MRWRPTKLSMRKDHASLQDMARVPLGEAPGRPPRKVASADQLTSLMSRSPSADQLTSLMSRSPSLCGLTSLTVPGAPSASTNIPDGSTIVSSPLSRALSSHSKSPRRRKSDGATMPSPRPSGSGGYAPSSRVLLATIGPEKVDELQEPIMGPLDGFSLESTVARSLRDHQSPSKVAEPGSAGGSESASTHADSSPGISWITGTAPALSEMLEDRPYADFVNYTLRGIGQVCFCNNPFTGGLMLLALLWQSLYVATMGVIGVVAATATALLLGLDEGATRSGLFGFVSTQLPLPPLSQYMRRTARARALHPSDCYRMEQNGFLVGLGLATFDRGCFAADDCQLGAWHYSALAIPVVVIAALSTVFSVALGNLLVPVYSVPSFTLPFNLAAFLFLGTALGESLPPPAPFPFVPTHSQSCLAGCCCWCRCWCYRLCSTSHHTDSRAFPQPRTQTLLADISTASSYSSSTSAASSSAESYYDAVDWLLVLEAVPKGAFDTMRAKLIGHFQPCATDFYLHIDARMAGYIRTHPY